MRHRDRKRGSVLGIVLIVLVLVSILGSGVLTVTRMHAEDTAREVTAMQAFWTAEAGLAHVRCLANKRREPLAVIDCFGKNALSGSAGSGTYSVDVKDEPGWPNGGAVKRYLIASRGTCAGASQTVEMHARIDTFASYIHASHSEETSQGVDIWFTTGDVVDGLIYVDDRINVSGSPRFLQAVRSAASSVNYRDGGNASAFEGGLTLNAPLLDFNQYSDHLATLKSIAQEGGLVLTGDYRLRFYSDGRMTYQRTSGGTVTTNKLSKLNGAIYVEGNAHILPPLGQSASTVNGKVTLAASSQIYLDGDVVYASASGLNVFAPGFDPAHALKDSLGLVARDGVWVTGSGATTIHAAILVTSGDNGFSASHAGDRIGTPLINLFGSLSQYRRGVVGYTDGRGFRKNYRYDGRFLGEAPLHFPYSAYAFSQWRNDS
jgi:hypothetical protein